MICDLGCDLRFIAGQYMPRTHGAQMVSSSSSSKVLRTWTGPNVPPSLTLAQTSASFSNYLSDPTKFGDTLDE